VVGARRPGDARAGRPRPRRPGDRCHVFSHLVLDVLVHVAGLPVLGPASYRLGLGLWRYPRLELALECGIAALGWWAYRGSSVAPRGAARWGLAALVAASAVMTVMGTLTSTPPPAPAVMAVVSLILITVLSTLAARLDRLSVRR